MIVKPTYVFRDLPYIGEYILTFLPHPFHDFRRTYERCVVTKIHGTLIKRIEEIRDMVARGLIEDDNSGAFSVRTNAYCIKQIEYFLVDETYVPFDRLLTICRNYKCDWFYRSIQKVQAMKWTLRRERRRLFG